MDISVTLCTKCRSWSGVCDLHNWKIHRSYRDRWTRTCSEHCGPVVKLSFLRSLFCKEDMSYLGLTTSLSRICRSDPRSQRSMQNLLVHLCRLGRRIVPVPFWTLAWHYQRLASLAHQLTKPCVAFYQSIERGWPSIKERQLRRWLRMAGA